MSNSNESKQYFKEYYRKNKERIDEIGNEIIHCPCMRYSMKDGFKLKSKRSHMRSSRHRKYWVTHDLEEHIRDCHDECCFCKLV